MKRIDFIASLLQGYEVAMDIGSDHGLVLKEALEQGYIKRGIATDNKVGPLNASQETLKNYDVKFYLSDGFKSVLDHADVAVITGMGAHLIASILDHAPKNMDFILGPNDRLEVLREYLASHEFMIVDEYVVKDGFYYVFLKVKYGKMSLTEQELYGGIYLKDKEEGRAYLMHQLTYYRGLVTKADEVKKLKLIKIIGYLENTLNL